jgi:hypothetical protein
MAIRIRFPYDRRSGGDRRRIVNRGYFRNGGDERRGGEERRSGNERRRDWVKVTKWSSAWSEFTHTKKNAERRYAVGEKRS